MMALVACSQKLTLASYARFITPTWRRCRFIDIVLHGRCKSSHARCFQTLCCKVTHGIDKEIREIHTCKDDGKAKNTNAKATSKRKTDSKKADIAYEPYWDESVIQKIEEEHPELVVRGTVIIPAFATTEATVVVHKRGTANAFQDSSHLQKDITDDVKSHTDNAKAPKPRGITDCSNNNECTSNANISDITTTVAGENHSESRQASVDDEVRQVDKGVRIFGFISRNRAFHGDEVVGIRQRRSRQPTSETVHPQSITEQCRVVRITKRSSALSSFVGVIDVESCLGSSGSIKCQPQDTRWPAFNVPTSDINPDLMQQLKNRGNDTRVLCLMRFEGWHENDIEPNGSIIRIIGDVSDPDAQMEATMTFHGLNPNGFSESVIQDLKNLINSAEEIKDQNRLDYTDQLVFTIDPQDAKDLDDALSVEISKVESDKYKYRVGVHIADVSHYVKGGSLVDLDARQRATSVYLEHRVFPMLPHHLSENLCSLLPGSEKLCFTMFVDLVDGPCDGEMVGYDMHVKNQSFVLTRIISKKRLSYQTAKEIIYQKMQCIPNVTTAKMESMTIDEFQRIIVNTPISRTSRNLDTMTTTSGDQYHRETGACTNPLMTSLDNMPRVEHVSNPKDEELANALLILYFISRKLRHFRLKQRGAVTVDINGSQKCHIPRVDKNGARLWLEQIPKESHELVEEMMLLANTQAAQLLAKSFDRYFLRVHENTSNAIKELVTSMMPQELRNIINPEVLRIPELLRKCAKHMEPTAFQSLSFAALQQFKEAVYSPVEKDDRSTMAVSGHWGLALPMYLHFTSPIRRYSDLYTHRMLKTVIDGTYTEQSLKVLDEICNQCNIQKRKAFDVQKDYKNFAFNQYLRWTCTTEDGSEPYAVGDPMFAKGLNKEAKDVWGMVYDDACVFSILLNDIQNKNTNNKSSIVFYIPMLNEQRSVSCDALNVEPIEAIVGREKIKLGGNPPVQNTDTMVDGYHKEIKKQTRNQKDDNTVVHALNVRKGSDEVILSQYQKLRVILIPGSQMWTLRLPLNPH